MKTITKFVAAALLTMSAVAPALAFEPEAQILSERHMSAIDQNQAYRAHAQATFAPVTTIAPEAQQLVERDAYQNQAINAHAEVRSSAGTRRY